MPEWRDHYWLLNALRVAYIIWFQWFILTLIWPTVFCKCSMWMCLLCLSCFFLYYRKHRGKREKFLNYVFTARWPHFLSNSQRHRYRKIYFTLFFLLLYLLRGSNPFQLAFPFLLDWKENSGTLEMDTFGRLCKRVTLRYRDRSEQMVTSQAVFQSAEECNRRWFYPILCWTLNSLRKLWPAFQEGR